MKHSHFTYLINVISKVVDRQARFRIMKSVVNKIKVISSVETQLYLSFWCCQVGRSDQFGHHVRWFQLVTVRVTVHFKVPSFENNTEYIFENLFLFEMYEDNNVKYIYIIINTRKVTARSVIIYEFYMFIRYNWLETMTVTIGSTL